MKKRLILFALAWLSICLFTEAANSKEIIRDKSPDGKFALRITGEDGGWSAGIIDLKSKEDVVSLEIYQNFTEEAHLFWSKDSQRVAYFEPDRRGGGTTIYFRKDSKFEQVELPELPECKHSGAKEETYVKTIESTTKPQQWLSSGALVIKLHSDDLMENDRSRKCTQVITINFDSSGKASVQSAKRVK